MREAQGEELWLPEHLEVAAAEAQRGRELVNPQEERLRELISGKSGIIPKEELFRAIGLDAHRTSNRNPTHELLVDRVMKAEGWVTDRKRKSAATFGFGKQQENRVRVFKRDGPDGSGDVWLRFDAETSGFLESQFDYSEEFSEIAHEHNLSSLT